MAYKFQRGISILSGAVDQEGGITIKDPATGALKATFSDTGEISGSHNLSIQGTVKFLGTAAAASTLDEDAFFYMDATDGLMKRESMSNYATQIAGDGLAATDGVLAVDFNELTAADVNVADDSIIFIDANGNVTRKDSFVDYATAAAGVGIGASGGQFSLDLHELTAVNIASGDFIGIVDGSDNSTKKDSVDDLATLFAGAGLAASAAVLSVQVSGAVKVASDKVGLSGSIAGNGLGFAGGVDSIASLAVNVDDSTIEIDSDSIRLKDDGVTGAKLAPAVAGYGLAQDGSGNLDVDLSELTAEAIASGDFLAFQDVTDDGTHKETVDDLAALFAGDGLSAASAVISIATSGSALTIASESLVSAARSLVTVLTVVQVTVSIQFVHFTLLLMKAPSSLLVALHSASKMTVSPVLNLLQLSLVLVSSKMVLVTSTLTLTS